MKLSGHLIIAVCIAIVVFVCLSAFIKFILYSLLPVAIAVLAAFIIFKVLDDYKK